MTSLPGFRTGTRLVTVFSMIAGAVYPSGFIRAPANYAPTLRPHLHNMAQLGYTHWVSIAPYLLQLLGGTINYTLETSRSMLTQHKICTNKIFKGKLVHTLHLHGK